MGEAGQGLYELWCRGANYVSRWDDLNDAEKAGWAAVEDHVLSFSPTGEAQDAD